jgi:serine/threonine protein kinase
VGKGAFGKVTLG